MIRLAFLAVITLPVVHSAPAFSQSRYRIDEVVMTGNESFSTGDLQDVAFIQTPSWINENILNAEPSYYAEDIELQVVTQLTNFYQKEGFLTVHVGRPEITIDDAEKKVAIKIAIVENSPVLVGEIAVRFNDSLSQGKMNFDSLFSEADISWKLRKGKRFRDELATQDQDALTLLLASHGFPYTTIRANLHFAPGDTVVDVTWDVLPGTMSYFGGVSFAGNDRTPDGVLTRSLDFEAGVIYDITKIKSSQRNLFNLSVFHGVNCKAQLGGPPPEVIPMNIRVQEAPTYTTKFGIGYGKDDKFRAFASLQWIRFLGDARVLDLFVKHSALEPYHVSVTFTQPDFPFRLAKFLLNPYALKEVEPSYTATRLGSNISLKRDFFDNLELSTTYTYERVDRLSSSVDSSSGAYNKSSVGLMFLNDASRPLFDPVKGWNVSGGVTYTRILQYDSTFWKTGIDVRKYFETSNAITLACKVKVGVIIPIFSGNTVPPEERLYSGGSTSVRGFPRSSLGPTDIYGTAIGGNSLFETSVEARVAMFGLFGLAFFCDAGNVWATPAAVYLNDLRYAAGAGVRFKTPVGPIRVDIATPIFEGGGSVEYYFTLGHAF